MKIYNPTAKKLCTATVLKLDEDNATRKHFNNHHDGTMFFRLYSFMSNQNHTEPFPLGMSIHYHKILNTNPVDRFVLSVPDVKFNDNNSTSTIKLLDGSI